MPQPNLLRRMLNIISLKFRGQPNPPELPVLHAHAIKNILSFIPLRDRVQTQRALFNASPTIFREASFALNSEKTLESQEVFAAIRDLAGLYARKKIAVVIYGEDNEVKLRRYQLALTQPLRELVVFEAVAFKPYHPVTIPPQREKFQRDFNDVVIAFPQTAKEAEEICRDYFRIGEFAPGEYNEIPYQTNLVLVAPATNEFGIDFDDVMTQMRKLLPMPHNQHIHSLYLSNEIYPTCNEDKYNDALLRRVLHDVAINEKGHKPIPKLLAANKTAEIRDIYNKNNILSKMSALVSRIESFCKTHFNMDLIANEIKPLDSHLADRYELTLELLNSLEWSHLLNHYRLDECLTIVKLTISTFGWGGLYELSEIYSKSCQKGSTKAKLDALLDTPFCKTIKNIQVFKPRYEKSADNYCKYTASIMTKPSLNDLISLMKPLILEIQENKDFLDKISRDPSLINSLTQDVLQLDTEFSLLKAMHDFYQATHQPDTTVAGVELWNKIAPLFKCLSNDLKIKIDKKNNKIDDNKKRAAFLLLLESTTALLNNPLSIAHAENLNKNISLVENAFSTCKNKRMREKLKCALIAIKAFLMLAVYNLLVLAPLFFDPDTSIEFATTFTACANAFLCFSMFPALKDLLASTLVTSVPATETSTELSLAVNGCKELSQNKACFFAVENKAEPKILSRSRDSSLKCPNKGGNHATA